VKAAAPSGGGTKRVKVCTSCIKSGKGIKGEEQFFVVRSQFSVIPLE
jgi:ribosomal protein L28